MDIKKAADSLINDKNPVKAVEKATGIDYKDTKKLTGFISETGKIMPRRMSGVCAKHQRDLAVAIKRARVMALLPFAGERF